MRSKYNKANFHILLHHRELFANAINGSIRTITAAQFEDSLSLMKSILSHSKVSLRSANALSYSLVRCEVPVEIFRFENDNRLLNTDIEFNRQDFDTLLEPCDMIVPVGEYRKDIISFEG